MKTKSLNPVFLLASLLALLALGGCGYKFRGSGSVLPDDVKSVAIPVVKNNTSESGLGIEFTEKLRSRFERFGVVDVLESNSDADAVLETVIKRVYTEVRDVTGVTDISLEEDLILVIDSELKRRNGQILWRVDDYVVRETFAGTSDVVVTSSSSFTQSGIGVGTLGTIGNREVSRGQQRLALSEMLDEASRVIYEDAVAADF